MYEPLISNIAITTAAGVSGDRPLVLPLALRTACSTFPLRELPLLHQTDAVESLGAQGVDHWLYRGKVLGDNL